LILGFSLAAQLNTASIAPVHNNILPQSMIVSVAETKQGLYKEYFFWFFCESSHCIFMIGISLIGISNDCTYNYNVNDCDRNDWKLSIF
jgi:hypothetical protein